MPPTDPFKTNIDPVFKGSQAQTKEPTEQNAPISAFGVLNGQKYSAAPAPATPQAVNPDQKTGERGALKSIIRTYRGDLESVIAANHLSSVNIAIAENQKMQEKIRIEQAEEKPAVTGEYSRNKILVFIGVILVTAGIVAMVAVYLIKNQGAVKVATQARELPSMITTEYRDELNTTNIIKSKFPSALSSRINDTEIPSGNLYNPYITSGTSTGRRLITTAEFISLMGWQMPDLIKRTLLPDFMVGMYSLGGNRPFVILKTSYFENAYAGMLQWEPDLEKDFRILFRLPGYDKAGSLATELTPTMTKDFEDGVVANNDVRILRNETGNSLLLYGIINKETIIITVDDTAFKEVIDRLNKEKTLQR